MIHRVIVYNKKLDDYVRIYDDEKITVHTDNVVNLVTSAILLEFELQRNFKTPMKGKRQIELGKYQIAYRFIQDYIYITIQDALDNEPFLYNLLELVIEIHHEDILQLEFASHNKLVEQLHQKVKDSITTQIFPFEIIHNIDQMVLEFLALTQNSIDTIFLTDLDNGLIKNWTPNQDRIVRVLQEILSEMEFERQWIGEIINEKLMGLKEIWFINRIGMTDFCLAGRSYIKNKTEVRSRFIRNLETISNEIHSMVLAHMEAVQ